MGRDLTNLYISESFNYLLQKSGSEVQNGLGVTITDLSASFATTSITSSLPLRGFIGVEVGEGSLTFTTGDGAETIVPISVTGSVSQSLSASYASTADQVKVVSDTTNNARYVTYVDVTNGRDDLRAESQFTYNPSTNILTVGTVNGDLSGNADTATSASHAVQADNAINADSASTSTYAQNTITTGKNLEGTEITKGTPLYFTGSGTAGNLVGIYRADAGNPNRMPAGGIAGEAIAAGAEGVVLLDGYIGGVNTSAFAPGEKVYVGVGGGYTNVEPTGSSNLVQYLGNVEKSAVNGSGVIQMMGEARRLPNLAENNVWKGDANGVPQSVNQSTLSVASAVTATSASHAVQADNATSATNASTASIVTDSNVAYQNQNNNFTGNQTFNDITVNGTGSFAYIQSVTGSAKVIGDAFLILNADSPTQRYAGIKVYDSGSTPPTTASLQFDGVSNDWFYQYSGSDETDFGVVMFGPEYATQGSPTYLTNNRLPKGDGGHHLNDSNISDDGSIVSINSNTNITGSLRGSGSFNIDHPGAPTNTERHLFDLPAYTTSDGASYPNRFVGLQNYPAFGQSYEGGVSITHADPGLAYQYYTELFVGPNLASLLINPSGSAGVAGISAAPTNDLSETYAYIYGDDIRLGNNIAAQEIKIGANGTAVEISGSLSVQNTINGEITNATLATTASSVSTLNQNVDINGNLEVIGTTNLTGSFFSSGSTFNADVPNPANNTESHLFDLGATTTSDGASYPIRWMGQQNYGAFGQAFEDAWSVSHVDPGAAYGYYTELLVGPNAAQMQLKPSSSATLANFSLGAASDLSTTFANVFANEVNVGHLLTQDIQIGNASSDNSILGTNTRIQSVVDITGSLAITGSGSNNFWKSDWPTNFGTKTIWDLGPQTTADGVLYDNARFRIFNYGSVSRALNGWLLNFDGDSENYYNSFWHGPQASYFLLRPSGSAADSTIRLSNDSGDTTNLTLHADSLEFGSGTSQKIEIKGEISGSVVHEVASLAIASTTASIDGGRASYFTLDLVSGSNTHIEGGSVVGGQTYILKTTQPGTGAGTITFDPFFKFAGGTAPTATADANAVDIYTFVAFDNNDLYATQVANLS